MTTTNRAPQAEAEPMEPGWYWHRTYSAVTGEHSGRWVPVEVVRYAGALMVAHSYGSPTSLQRDGWGPRIPEPGAAPAEPALNVADERDEREGFAKDRWWCPMGHWCRVSRGGCCLSCGATVATPEYVALTGAWTDQAKPCDEPGCVGGVIDVPGPRCAVECPKCGRSETGRLRRALAEARAEVERLRTERFNDNAAMSMELLKFRERVRELEAQLRRTVQWAEWVRQPGVCGEPEWRDEVAGLQHEAERVLASTPAPAEPTPPSSGAEPASRHVAVDPWHQGDEWMSGPQEAAPTCTVHCAGPMGCDWDEPTGAPTGATPEDEYRDAPPDYMPWYNGEGSWFAAVSPPIGLSCETREEAIAACYKHRDRVTADATAELRAERDKLAEKVKRQAHDARIKDDALASRSRELDALGRVWCDGGCGGGWYRHRDGDAEPTAEQVAFLLRNAYRALRWYVNHGPKGAKESDIKKWPALWEKSETAVLEALAQGDALTSKLAEAERRAEALQAELDDLRAHRQEGRDA